MAMMSRQWSEWKEVEEGGEDQVYSIRQVLSYLRGAYRDEVYEKAERLLMVREERIRDEVAEEMKKKVEVEERLRNELVVKFGEAEVRLRELEKENMRLRDGERQRGELRGLKRKIEVDEGSRKKEMVEERMRELEKECKELRKGNMRLREEEKRAVGMCERLSMKISEMEDDANERIKEMEMKVEVEVGLRKKAEEELEVSRNKFKELELKISSMNKDIDLVKSLEADAQGSGMEAENEHSTEAEAEVEAEVQAAVRVASDHSEKGGAVPSVKAAEDTAKEAAIPVSPVSVADLKRSVPLDTFLKDSRFEGEKPTTDDWKPRHGVGSRIEISSSSDDDPSELLLRSKYKSDLAPVELDFESDHDSPEVSSGLKRKTMSSNNEDKTESTPQPSTGERINKKMRPSSASLTPPPGFNFPKSVTAGRPDGGISWSQKVTLDDEQYKKALFEKLKNKYWDDVSSESSSDL